ncbi:MAG: hypothetical protein C4345_09960, partial [Chloroflexota bacterium]
GVGVYRPPLRFNCPPEVTMIELVAEPAGSTELGQKSEARELRSDGSVRSDEARGGRHDGT